MKRPACAEVFINQLSHAAEVFSDSLDSLPAASRIARQRASMAMSVRVAASVRQFDLFHFDCSCSYSTV
jgi:hypothetical protein